MVEVGAVRLNARTVKPSVEVRVGDRLEVAFPRRMLVVEILTTDERELKRGVSSVSTMEDRRLEEDERPW